MNKVSSGPSRPLHDYQGWRPCSLRGDPIDVDEPLYIHQYIVGRLGTVEMVLT